MASDRKSEPELARVVAFRPADSPIQDGVLAEHRAGVLEETAGEDSARPGAVPPPAPTRPAPHESISARLRARFEEG